MGRIREAYRIAAEMLEADPRAENDALMVAAELSLDPEGRISEEERIEVANDWFRWLRLDGDPEIFAIHDDKLYCGELDTLIVELEAAYCLEHEVVKCRHCGSYEDVREDHTDETPQDCEGCDYLVDGTPKQDVRKSLEQEFDDVRDSGDDLVLVARERLPTHVTPSRYSYVFLTVRYLTPCRDLNVTLNVMLSVVNVSMAGRAGWRAACRSYGMDPDHVVPQLQKAEMLLDYGTAAIIYDSAGSCLQRLVAGAMEQYRMLSIMGGAVLDRRQNAIGSTGWDLMRGDVMAGLKRYRQGPGGDGAMDLMSRLQGTLDGEQETEEE